MHQANHVSEHEQASVLDAKKSRIHSSTTKPLLLDAPQSNGKSQASDKNVSAANKKLKKADTRSRTEKKSSSPQQQQPIPLRIRSDKSRIMKVSYPNRRLFMHLALLFSLSGCILMCFATFTNDWLYSAERLKFMNLTNEEPELSQSFKPPTFFKNATFGPWRYCWEDPNTAFDCFGRVGIYTSDDGESDGDASDATTAVEVATRKCVFYLFATCIAYFISALMIVWYQAKAMPSNVTVLAAGVSHILAGMTNLLTLIVYISAVTQEVGKKLSPASPLDDPTFYYDYGYSFYSAIASFVCMQVAALLTLSVYMAKHDEDMYNRYYLRSMFRSSGNELFAGMLIGGVQARRSSTTAGSGYHRRFRRTSSSLLSAHGGGSSGRASRENSYCSPIVIGPGPPPSGMQQNGMSYHENRHHLQLPSPTVLMPLQEHTASKDCLLQPPGGSFNLDFTALPISVDPTGSMQSQVTRNFGADDNNSALANTKV